LKETKRERAHHAIEININIWILLKIFY
jgi:hypothetical protein